LSLGLVLEQAGLVTTEKVGRVRTCRLGLRGLQEEAEWIEGYRQLWSARFDELDRARCLRRWTNSTNFSSAWDQQRQNDAANQSNNEMKRVAGLTARRD
jgi:hypothetical protein